MRDGNKCIKHKMDPEYIWSSQKLFNWTKLVQSKPLQTRKYI